MEITVLSFAKEVYKSIVYVDIFLFSWSQEKYLHSGNEYLSEY